MQELKVYKNYGVVSAEKRNIYTYGAEHPYAICSDEITVLVPDDWKLYENYMGKIMVESPWGRCYEINDVLTDIQGHPAFRALDKNQRPRTTYLYTVEELEEKKKKEEKKRERKKKKIKEQINNGDQ